MNDGLPIWWETDKEHVYERLLPHVRAVEQDHADYFDRFVLFGALYDPNGPEAELVDPRWRRQAWQMSENVVASNVNTVRAQVSANEVRPRFMTDGASWSVQRRARLMGQFAEEVGKLVSVDQIGEASFFGAALKGTWLAKVYADRDGEVRVESVPIDDIIVDDRDCVSGRPRQLHHRRVGVDRDWLVQQFPKFKEEIDAARRGGGWATELARWSLPGTATTITDLVVVESWRLPVGVRGRKGYKPGRHVICIDGCDLLDEPWHKPFFPFAELRWDERKGSFYGIGLAERIVGHQRKLDKREMQMDRAIDLYAKPTTYVDPADNNPRVLNTTFGAVVPIKGNRPTTVLPNAVGSELPRDRDYTKASAFEETGISRMAATSTKPAGLDSGVALREYRDSTAGRFAMQEKAYERFILRIYELLIDVCKDLGKAAPKMTRQSRFGERVIKWADVVMNEVRTTIAAASKLPRTPAGRTQFVLELSQAGLFSKDDALRLLDHPDVEQVLSLYTAAREAIEADLEHIEDGYPVIPEPDVNLKLAVWLAMNRYLKDRDAGAPESVLEGLRRYRAQAADHLSRAAAAAGPANMNAIPNGPPMATPQQVPAAGAPIIPAAAAAGAA